MRAFFEEKVMNLLVLFILFVIAGNVYCLVSLWKNGDTLMFSIGLFLFLLAPVSLYFG
jgi:hypothetical protein